MKHKSHKLGTMIIRKAILPIVIAIPVLVVVIVVSVPQVISLNTKAKMVNIVEQKRVTDPLYLGKVKAIGCEGNWYSPSCFIMNKQGVTWWFNDKGDGFEKRGEQ